MGRGVKTLKDEMTWAKWSIYNTKTVVTPILPGAECPLVLLQAKGMRPHSTKPKAKKNRWDIYTCVPAALSFLQLLRKVPRQAVSCDFMH